MTTVAVAASPTATLVGGLLAGTGSLHAALTADEVVAAVDGLRASPSHWSPSPFTDDRQLDERVQQLGRPLERWVPPDPALVDAVAEVLERGWRRAALQPTGTEWAPAALRFEVDSFDDLRQLWQMGRVGDWHIVGHVGMRAARISWSWPLRVTAATPMRLDALRASLRFHQHYRVDEAGDGDVVEIAVVDPSNVDFLDRVLASVAVVIDAASFDPSELLDRARGMGLAGVVLVPDAPSGFVDDLAMHLAHDEPLDVATSLTSPGASVVAGAELLGLTSIRTWAGFVAERADPASGVGATLRGILMTGSFDRESQGAEATISASSAGIAEPELRAIATIDLHEATAKPPEDDIAAPAEERRLQARVTDSSKRTRQDAFVAGERHRLSVRIAHIPQDVLASGEIVANEVFRSPVSGRDVELTVVVRVRGVQGRPKRRRLQLPATADSTWTSPITIDVPADVKELEVEILVLHEGRTVQTAVLRGPVVAPGTTPRRSARLVLAVDADTPPTGLASRTPAASTILVSTNAHGEPLVLDLSATARLLPPDRLDKASKAIRRVLLDTFLSPPVDLPGAAGPLTKLAVWGSTLRNQLKASTGGFHDDDPWIHIVSFGDALVPFELIYTHEMPDNDDEVPVCGPALAGAAECTAECADRTRSDVVCPFGFWATSKVVERRVHVDDRTRATAPLQRKVAVISGAVAGMSTKADEEDATASQRIVDAISAVVPKDRFRRVTTWKQLAEAVDVGRPGVIVLVTHTVKPPNDDDVLAVKFELGGDVHPAHRVDDTFVNPGLREPGPVVLALGCDTGDLDIGFADWVTTLHAAGAEVVVSTLSPVPGKEVALFIERMFSLLPKQFASAPPHRFGAVLTAVRRATVATGDVLALSVTASGDGDVELVGTP